MSQRNGRRDEAPRQRGAACVCYYVGQSSRQRGGNSQKTSLGSLWHRTFQNTIKIIELWYRFMKLFISNESML